jgi:hypothetical protein
MFGPSQLVESGWPSISYNRGTYGHTEVLSAIYGPYESRNSSKSNMSKSIIEVVISDLNIQTDHSASERVLSDLFSSVIKTQKYPYLTVMICIQLFTKDKNFLSACINSAFQALKASNIEINFSLIAADYEITGGGIATLAVIPNTDEILLSLCEKPVEFEVYKKLVLSLAGVA